MEVWSALAGLRFLLASVVAVSHLEDFATLGAWSVVPLFGRFEAVLGFLLISGYSIAHSYSKQPQGYLRRRVYRIFPIYLACLLLAVVALVLTTGAWPSAWSVLANVLFLNQLLTNTSLLAPAWSLSLEFWLYCLAPLLFTLSDRALRRLMFGSFIAYCLFTCGRTLFHWHYFAGLGGGLNLILLSFVWIAGFRLALAPERKMPILKDIGWMFVLHIGLVASIQFASRMKHARLDEFLDADLIAFALQAASLAGVWWAFRRLQAKKGSAGKASRSLRILGDISYPLYLIHIPVYQLLEFSGVPASPALYYGLAVLASAMLYRAVDFYSQRRHLAQPSLGAASASPVADSPNKLTT